MRISKSFKRVNITQVSISRQLNDIQTFSVKLCVLKFIDHYVYPFYKCNIDPSKLWFAQGQA